MVWLDEMDRNVMNFPKALFDRRGAAVERAIAIGYRFICHIPQKRSFSRP
jgi:hypothetical protein